MPFDEKIDTGTSDPSKLKSRVFVGNAPTFGATKAEYKQLFDCFGNILAVSVHKGFVFVQYSNEEGALEACRQMNGFMYKDYKLEVSISKGAAGKKKDVGPRQSAPGVGDDRGRQRQGSGQAVGPNSRRRSPLGDNRRGRNDRDRDRTNSRERGLDYDAGRAERRRSRDRSPVRGRANVDRLGRDLSLREEFARGSFRATGKSRFEDVGADRRLEVQVDRHSSDNYRETAMDLSPGPSLSTDCEIVIPHHTQRQYGELVESRLKNLGINCDILFPHDPNQLTQVLDDISRRGCRYAIVLLPQNEQHKSATVHILWGKTPEEHRNMPLDKAMNLIACNYENYLTSVREKAEAAAEVEAMVSPLAQPMGSSMVQPMVPVRADASLSVENQADHDDGIQDLFKLLADGRPLSVPQIDAVVRHLLQRRMQMLNEDEPPAAVAAAVATPAASSGLAPYTSGVSDVPEPDIFPTSDSEPHIEKEIADQQAEIQKRILNILTCLAAPAMNIAATTTAQVPLGAQLNPAAQTMGFDDSSVHKQLDTLSQKAMMLRGLHSGPPPSMQGMQPHSALASQQMQLAMAQQQHQQQPNTNSQMSGLGMSSDMKNARSMSRRVAGNARGFMGAGGMMGQTRY